MTNIYTVSVPLPDRAYDVRIGDGLLERAGNEIDPFLNRKRVRIVTDKNVADLHLNALQNALSASGIESAALVLPAGEATKNWSSLTKTVDWLLAEQVERRDLIIALGGGVIGDLVGFAAAILRRGTGHAVARGRRRQDVPDPVR